MDSIYLGFTAFLFVLAVFDLISGVSNDAVNFLNSAIGARVATFKTIIIVAAAGVFLGASMSNGMMEVARHGVFHPSMFSFREVMFIFLAVMSFSWTCSTPSACRHPRQCQWYSNSSEEHSRWLWSSHSRTREST